MPIAGIFLSITSLFICIAGVLFVHLHLTTEQEYKQLQRT